MENVSIWAGGASEPAPRRACASGDSGREGYDVTSGDVDSVVVVVVSLVGSARCPAAFVRCSWIVELGVRASGVVGTGGVWMGVGETLQFVVVGWW